MNENIEPSAPVSCPVCHEPVRPEFYFCPNCGKNLKEKPLSTSLGAQIKIYLWSILTPPMCFLTIGSWHGVKYLKSNDPKAKKIGMVAIILLALSTVLTVWLVYVLVIQFEQSVQSLSSGLLPGI
jgi:hypothetical protein